MLPVRRNRSLGKQAANSQPQKTRSKPQSVKSSRSKTQNSVPLDWQGILDDVNFIRCKLDEAEQSKLDEKPKAAMQQLLFHTEFLYGQPQSIESVHTLYTQVLQLHRANSLLMQEVAKLTKELEQSQQKLYQSEIANSVLREENKRIQTEFVRKVDAKPQLPLYCVSRVEPPKDTNYHTGAFSAQCNTASTRFTDEIPSKKHSRAVLLQPYECNITPKNKQGTPKQEAMDILNQQFDHLMKQSRMTRTSSMRQYLRKQLFGISEQIKRLNQPHFS